MNIKNVILEEVCESASKLLFDLIEQKKIYNDGIVFRGVSSDSYSLQPSLLREDNISKIMEKLEKKGYKKNLFGFLRNELNILINFSHLCNKNNLPCAKTFQIDLENNYLNRLTELVELNSKDWLPITYLDVASLAQHYSVPTRLLDWSNNPFIALYFATRKKNTNKNIAIWSFNLGNISSLNCHLKRFGLSHLSLNIGYIDGMSNPNILAQNGILTYIKKRFSTEHFEDKTIDDLPLEDYIKYQINLIKLKIEEYPKKYSSLYEVVLNRNYLKKYILPVDEIQELKNYLNAFDYTTFKLFPSYDGIATHLNDIFF